MNPHSTIEVSLGGDVKALSDGGFEGLLVPFGSERTPDRSPKRDWFPPDAEYGFKRGETISSPLFYHHGLDSKIKAKQFGRVNLFFADDGIRTTGRIDTSSDEGKWLNGQVQAGAMKMSSGVPFYLIDRERVGDTHRVTRWILGSDASLTPTPADERTYASSIKALMETGMGYSPANPMANLSRTGLHGALDRIHHATHAAIHMHLATKDVSPFDKKCNCAKCYDEQKRVAMKMISAGVKDMDGDDDSFDSVDTDDDSKAIVSEHMKALFTGLRLTDHLALALDAAAGVCGRLTEFAALKARDGRTISPGRVGEIRRYMSELDAIVTAASKPSTDEANALANRALALLAQTAGLGDY